MAKVNGKRNILSVLLIMIYCLLPRTSFLVNDHLTFFSQFRNIMVGVISIGLLTVLLMGNSKENRRHLSMVNLLFAAYALWFLIQLGCMVWPEFY